MIKRIASAVILIPIVVWLVIFAKSDYFGIAVLFISLLAYVEWLNMDSAVFDLTKSLYFALAALFVFTLIFYTPFAAEALFFVFIANMIISFKSLEKNALLSNYYFLGGIIYVSLYSFSYFLIGKDNGRLILMLLFIAIWAGDSFAYFCGRAFGKHKLAKKISPKKTVEGAVCGIILGSVFGAIFAYIVGFPIKNGLIIAFLANIAGIFGDLAESVIKRAFNKKDSSNLIPGHGGILDRLDSIAFAVFFVYILILWKIL